MIKNTTERKRTANKENGTGAECKPTGNGDDREKAETRTGKGGEMGHDQTSAKKLKL
jgi:hypothetical protein